MSAAIAALVSILPNLLRWGKRPAARTACRPIVSKAAVAALDQRLGGMEERLSRIEARLDRLYEILLAGGPRG